MFLNYKNQLFFLFFILGTGLGFGFSLSLGRLFEVVLIILLILSIFWFGLDKRDQKKIMVILLLLIFFTVGFWNMAKAKAKISEELDKLNNLNNKDVSGSAKMGHCDRLNEEGASCRIYDVVIEGKGKIESGLIIYPDLPSLEENHFSYGEKIYFEGSFKLLQGPSWEASYNNFLLKQGIVAILVKEKVRGLGKTGGEELSQNEKITRLIDSVQKKTSAHFFKLWDDEELGLLMALILGNRSYLDPSVKETFQKIGIVHLVAVSGFHLALLFGFLSYIFTKILIIRRGLFFLFALCCLGFFVILINTPASAIRAYLMFFLRITARVLGRKNHPNLILLTAAFLMLLFNPLLLIYDIGFQLSFSACLGLINLSPRIAELFKFFPNVFGVSYFKDVIVATLSAQVATLPLTVIYFNYLSLAAIAANCLLFWIVGPLTIVSLAALFFSFWGMGVAKLLAFVSGAGVKLMLKISDKIACFDYAGINFNPSQTNIWFGWLIIIICFLFLVGGKKEETRFDWL